MGRVLVLAVLALCVPAAISSQTLAVLRIRAVLTDAAGQSRPVARHALLVSDEPQTQETRRILTSIDGVANVRLRPGTYVVESDQPVAFEGKAYRWRQTLNIVAGRDSSLDLTLANAVAEAIAPGTATAAVEPSAPGTANADAPRTTDTSFLLRQWLDSVVQLWTPTAHASGFLVDASGLIATNQRVIGDATSVEVQLSRSIKVAGTVLEADPQRDIAIVRIDPSVMAAMKPVPLGCPRDSAPGVARGQEIFTLAAPLRQNKGWTPGAVSRNDTRAFMADLSLATGGTGGPVFTASGDLVGITTLPDERDEPRRSSTRVVRISGACELVAAAAKKAQETPTPSGARLPVEPMEPAPVAAFKEAVTRRAGNLKPYQMAATDFDVAFITPVLNYAAQSQSNQIFSNWSEYVSDIPPVLFVRVTPKMAESFWAKMGRAAASTQGMNLPAFKRLKTGFQRLQAFCGKTEVTPIHPFKLDLRVSETEAIYEGLYAFDPAALGPGCGSVTLVLYSEKEPAKADTRVVDPGILQQIWRDLDIGVKR
jgi:S1-C subfamily serine protease